MTNVAFKSLKDYDDVWVRNTMKKLEEEEGDLDGFLRYVHVAGRDNARTPVQWDDTDYAGFTSGKPWLALNPNYPVINAADAVADHDSIYHFIRKFIRYRKTDLAWVYGSFEDLAPTHDKIFIYLRKLEKTQLLVVLNMSDETQLYILPKEAGQKDRILEFSNYEFNIAMSEDAIVLQPWEAKVYRLS